MNRGGELLAVHVERDGAPASLGGHALIAVAGETVVVGNLSGTHGGRPGREKEEERSDKAGSDGPAAWRRSH